MCRFQCPRAYLLGPKPPSLLRLGRDRLIFIRSKLQHCWANFKHREVRVRDAIFLQNLLPNCSTVVCPLLGPNPTTMCFIIVKLEASERGGVVRRILRHTYTDRGVDDLGRPDRIEFREIFRRTGEYARGGTPESGVPRLCHWVREDFRLGDKAASTGTSASPALVRFQPGRPPGFKDVLAGGAIH